MVVTRQMYQQGLLTLQTIVIDALAGETLQVTLVVNFGYWIAELYLIC